MEKLFLWGIVLCITISMLTGTAAQLGKSVLETGKAAISLTITLAGAYCLWCGILRIMDDSGLTARLASILRPLLKRLFPQVEPASKAEEAIAENFAANLLGMGNAATPAGLSAMRELKHIAEKNRQNLPTSAMCLFLILNNSSLQLIPTTLVSLRAAGGSASPADILLPALLSSAGSTLSALLLWRMMQCLLRRKGE